MSSSVWDKIYKDFQESGVAWATLEGGLEPHFKEFIEQADFPKKNAFDIGYGTGQYLQYLKLKDFTVAGIDSSPTARDMASKAVDNEVLVVGDMYEYELPKDRFDLILSISTIHHGRKAQIKALLDKVYDALVVGGYVYITLPARDSSNEWITFKDKDEIEPGTFAPNKGPEKGLPHSFYTKDEVEKLFNRYADAIIDKSKGRWFVRGKKNE